MRGGMERTMSTYDLLVGDVLVVDTGDILPADGLLFESSNLRCAQTHEERCCATCWSTCLRRLSGKMTMFWCCGPCGAVAAVRHCAEALRLWRHDHGCPQAG